MQYNPSRKALFNPELQPPLEMDGNWSGDAICAEFSRLAYFRFENGRPFQDVITAAVAKVKFGDLGFFNDPRATADREKLDSQGFAAIDPGGHAIVAFRGTQPGSFRDILTDLDIRRVQWGGGGRVHSGFWNALQAILSQVNEWLGSRTVNRLTITGHSLGGALATLLAGLRPGAELVTFGSPRVGDAAFADAFAGRAVRRYVDTTDIVTGLPFPGFKHVAGQRYIDPDGVIHVTENGPSAADVFKANADYLRCIPNINNIPLRNFADHAPINYIGALLGGRTGP